MGLASSVKRDFTSVTWALIPLAICINIVVGQIASALKLPIYIDTIGTILVAIVCGPWAGALTGALSNIIWGLFAPGALPFFPVAAWIGFIAGWCGIWGLYKTWWKVIIAGLIIALTTPFIATPIVVYVYGGVEGSGASLITGVLIKSGMKISSAAFYKNLMVEPLDKIPSALIAWVLAKQMPARFISRFPRVENFAA
ncbi:ECF transporter S component [Salidesulfovibrio brasiliensis]|uniref:ECF transporter S component n=1 Tax=Salidesulfovibrio brasiliensis TaxID=221711 RepID=UPI0006CF2118|nr:ECF transporter S component [Salidesulfovibrio brasiliensis]